MAQHHLLTFMVHISRMLNQKWRNWDSKQPLWQGMQALEVVSSIVMSNACVKIVYFSQTILLVNSWACGRVLRNFQRSMEHLFPTIFIRCVNTQELSECICLSSLKSLSCSHIACYPEPCTCLRQQSLGSLVFSFSFFSLNHPTSFHKTVF